MDQEIRFDGFGAPPAAAGEGRATHGAPQRGGVTLPQAWRMASAVSGQFEVCLLARGRRSTPPEGLPKVGDILPSALTTGLARGVAEVDDFSAHLFVHDGRAGHSVAAQGYEPATRTFLYFDSWA